MYGSEQVATGLLLAIGVCRVVSNSILKVALVMVVETVGAVGVEVVQGLVNKAKTLGIQMLRTPL
jgi:hypothetical protein